MCLWGCELSLHCVRESQPRKQTQSGLWCDCDVHLGGHHARALVLMKILTLKRDAPFPIRLPIRWVGVLAIVIGVRCPMTFSKLLKASGTRFPHLLFRGLTWG